MIPLLMTGNRKDSRTNEIYLVSEEWKIIHKVGAKTVLNQLFYFGQNDSVCLGPSAPPCSCNWQDGLDEVALYVTDGDGQLVDLELVSKSQLDSLLMHLGKLVFVLGDLGQGGLDGVALHVEDGELVNLELAAKGKLANLLLHLGELVLVLRDPPQDVLDELALRVTDGDGELEVAEDDLALQEERLETVPFVKVLLADLV